MTDKELMEAAYAEAVRGRDAGGLPIGSVLYSPGRGEIVARGHNLRVQTGDPTAHAEVVCVRAAGRRRDWETLTLVSTLSPCIMCSGTALLYRIPRVLVGEHQNFQGAEDLLRSRGVEVTVLGDPRCVTLMERFVAERPELWAEDIGE
ncbi:MAG: nucleoside deaminase [Planctomycetota bacterium]